MIELQAHIKIILAEEKIKVRQLVPSSDLTLKLVDLVRFIDSYNYYYRNVDSSEKRFEFLEKSRYGWSLFFRHLYHEYTLTDKIPLYATDKKYVSWTRGVIDRCGSIELVYQYLDFSAAGLMTVSKKGHNHFVFKPVHEGPGDEIFEHLSLKFYFELALKALSQKTTRLKSQFGHIKEQVQAIVQPYHDIFIQYQATDEIDQYYSELARITLQTTQLYDDFGPEDTFGQASYKEYLDFVEYSTKAALMHKDAVALLTQKTEGAVDPFNNFSYSLSSSKFINSLTDYFGWSHDKTYKVVSTLVLNKENYLNHLSYPGAPVPPYFELGPDIWIRSMEGCLSSPVSFLNRQLKLKYRSDYFRAVNNREARFRKQLYSMFDENRIYRTENVVRVKMNSYNTDVDAVVFDKKRRILGLFQLKWQDTFSTSMRERRSRISNLYPVSIKWLDKIQYWISNSTHSEILGACGIQGSVIEDIFIFVLSRNHVHFTGQKLDHRATWGSWYQVVEASAKIKDPFQSNPIGEMAVQLSLTYPSARRKFEDISNVESTEITISDYRFTIETE